VETVMAFIRRLMQFIQSAGLLMGQMIGTLFRESLIGVIQALLFYLYFYTSHIHLIIIFILKPRRMTEAVHVARRGEKRNAYKILVGKPEGKRSLGRPSRKWVDNINIDLRETGWNGMDRIDLAQDGDQWRALVNTVMKLRVP
jgi:hypothetical protein